MLALNLGGIRYPWLSLPIAALLLCALVLGAGFVLRLRTAIEPLIPIAILADPAARLAIAAHSFGWGGDHQPQRISADVSAERVGLVANRGWIEPCHSDGDAQFDGRPIQSVARQGAALQAVTAVFLVHRCGGCCRAGAGGGRYDLISASKSSCF